MAQKNLKQKATSGMVWTSIQKFSSIGISFVSGIILARLLTPYDYGCIGMLSIFMVLAGSFIDGGFGSALIQKKRPTQTDYSTVFFWNMGMSVLMYAILFFTAPAISRFYNIPLLCDVLRVQGLVLFINAFNIIQSNQLRKNINFKAIAIVSITTSIISLGITIWMAYKGFGVWALVAQNLIAAAIPAFVFWFYVKWRPTWVFSWNSFKELFSFGFYMFLTSILNNFGVRLQGLLIGKVYSPITMGYYSKAQGTENMASLSISSIVTQVSYPLYAEVQDNKVVLGNIIKRITMTIAYITFPVLCILLLLAEPIFILLYSDRWLASVPYFQVLCIAGMGACLTAVNTQAIAAIGKSKEMFLWTVVKRVIGIAAVVGGMLWFGMKGLLIGVVFNSWFSYFINIYLVSKYIGYTFLNQVKDLIPVTLASIAATVVCYALGYYLNLNMYLDGFVKLIMFIFVYLVWSFCFKPEAYTYFLTILPDRFKFLKRLKKNN